MAGPTNAGCRLWGLDGGPRSRRWSACCWRPVWRAPVRSTHGPCPRRRLPNRLQRPGRFRCLPTKVLTPIISSGGTTTATSYWTTGTSSAFISSFSRRWQDGGGGLRSPTWELLMLPAPVTFTTFAMTQSRTESGRRSAGSGSRRLAPGRRGRPPFVCSGHR